MVHTLEELNNDSIGPVLARSFFDRQVLDIAADLIGRVIVHRTAEGPVAIRLTEVEAYAGGADPGSHAYRGRSPRNVVMFGPPGHVYVYFTYGMHYCMNLVCGPDGEASAVLLRAGEVVEGIDLAKQRRHTARADRDLARGPARLVVALGVGREDNGADVCGDGPLTVHRGVAVDRGRVRTGPRVGLAAAADRPWRFWLDGEPSVSPYKRHSPKRRTAGTAAARPARS